jgi:hypothetical protein
MRGKTGSGSVGRRPQLYTLPKSGNYTTPALANPKSRAGYRSAARRFAAFIGKIHQTMNDEAITAALHEHEQRNDHLKLDLEQKGVEDLNEPQPVDFHFWAWSQRDAAVLARSLYQMGFLIRLLAPAKAEDDPDRWFVEAGAKIPLLQAAGTELTEKLIRLAAEQDSVFDGWGTSV